MKKRNHKQTNIQMLMDTAKALVAGDKGLALPSGRFKQCAGCCAALAASQAWAVDSKSCRISRTKATAYWKSSKDADG